jgi:large subunit ribosomal protein L22
MVLALIRGKSTQSALAVLEGTGKRAALVVGKLVRSAVANAKNKGFEEEGLYISRIFADVGPTWKRFRANAFGRGSRILKRTTHVTVELDKKAGVPKNTAPATTKETAKKQLSKKKTLLSKKK